MSALLGPEVLNAVAEPREELSALVAEIAPLEGIVQRMSRLMLAQLAVGWRHRMFHVFGVLDIVRSMEGDDLGRRSARTKDATPFDHPPLRGLHHAHWFEARFLEKNLFQHYSGKRGNARLHEKIRSAGEVGETPEEQSSLIAHAAVVDGFEERSAASRLTGEWIVYRADPAGNDYLLLATHDEGDKNIEAAIRAHCEPRFVDAIEGW